MSLFAPPFDKLRVSGRAISLGLKTIRPSCESRNDGKGESAIRCDSPAFVLLHVPSWINFV